MQVLKNITLSFIISSLIAVVALIVNHHFDDFFDLDWGLDGLIAFAVTSGFLLSALSLFALFISKQFIRKHWVLRILVYYTGIIVSLVYVTVPLITIEYQYPEDWLPTVIVLNFMIPYTFFYLKTFKKRLIIT
ncbi:hypothetical protein BDD43_3175 [Mucilaginibacter gracilis]|uniref:Uncharacterized protein n=1 Tax=Mucilaginibacter gracilis TaxID=423350 RepID=A0A495J1X2_9SPHI|nr:hypothetical protein [Mucilaginibacter gracilis]RKR82976.1 hypothetical protein BDD43_3175 [Mucilaginibacter gracilis]